MRTNSDLWIDRQKKIRGDLWDKNCFRETPNGLIDFGYKRETESGLAIVKNYQEKGFPDPDMIHHTHQEGEISDSRVTQESSDKLFIEWVYVIDEEAEKIHVLAAGQVGKTLKSLKQIGPSQRISTGEHYAHFHLKSVSFDAYEFPNDIRQSAYPKNAHV